MFNWIYHNAYSVLLLFGGISVIALMILRRQRYSLSVWKAGILGLALMIFAVVGAKLLYILESKGDTTGMSLFGAVFLVLFCIPLISRFFSLSGNEALDACAPCGASVIGFVRFGCYLAGCCGGWYTTIAGRVFQWPTQLIESLCDFAILGLLLQMEQKEHKKGSLYAWFLILYCASRFLIEFLRDTPKDWLGMSHGQWFALIGIALGLGVLFYAYCLMEVKYDAKTKN